MSVEMALVDAVTTAGDLAGLLHWGTTDIRVFGLLFLFFFSWAAQSLQTF